MKINRQFAWVLFGILLIHVIAITAFQRSNEERRREQARADLPSQEKMGTTPREEIAESSTKGKTDEQRAAAKQAYLDLTSVSEDVFIDFGTDAQSDKTPTVEEPALFSSETAALPEPAPLADMEAPLEAPATDLARTETVLATETVADEPAQTLAVPAPLDRVEIEPVPTRNVVQNDTAPTPLTQREDVPPVSPAPQPESGIDRARLKPVQLSPLTIARPVLTSSVATKPEPLPIATPVLETPARGALKPISLPAERKAVSPAPPILRARPLPTPVQDSPAAVSPTPSRPDMKALPRVDRIRR